MYKLSYDSKYSDGRVDIYYENLRDAQYGLESLNYWERPKLESLRPSKEVQRSFNGWTVYE